IQWQIDNAPYMFKMNPEKKEYINTYNYYSQIKGLNPVTLSPNTLFVVRSRNEQIELDKFPTYLFFDRSSTLKYISVNDSYYKVRHEDNTVYLEQKVNRVFGMESYLHSQEAINISVNNSRS